MQSFEKFLQQFPNYTPSAYEAVKPYLKSMELKAGEYFLREGDVCQQIGFVQEGLLRLYYLHDGKEVTNCFCQENMLTSAYSSLITRRESEVAIQAIEDSRLMTLPYQSLLQLYKTGPFWQQVGRIAAEQELITRECHNRFLADQSATDRYLKILNDEPELLQRVPLTYLASYLQIAPETLSRIRNKINRT